MSYAYPKRFYVPHILGAISWELAGGERGRPLVSSATFKNDTILQFPLPALTVCAVKLRLLRAESTLGGTPGSATFLAMHTVTGQ